MNGWWVHSVFNAAGGGNEGFVAVASWVVVVIGSITLHELAHGWAALWEGDGTPRELGHMTGNPMVHMGTMSLLLFAVLGIAFGMMPVNPSRFRHGHVGRIVVAAAGPAINLLLFFMFAIALGLLMRSGASGSAASNFVTFLNMGAMLNLVLAALNLMPLPPLDGWRILEGCHWRVRALSNHPQAPIAALFVLMVLFMSGFGWIWGMAADAVAAVAGLVAG
jgi:Zn-dependent protease